MNNEYKQLSRMNRNNNNTVPTDYKGSNEVVSNINTSHNDFNQQSIEAFMSKELTKEDEQKVEKLIISLDPSKEETIMEYGIEEQRHLTKFSELMLKKVEQSKQNGIEQQLQFLMKKLNEIDPSELKQNEKKGIKKLLSKAKSSTKELLSRFKNISHEIDKVTIELNQSKSELIRDNELLNQLYNENKSYYDQLDLLIHAAEIKKQDLIQNDLKEAQLNLTKDDAIGAQQITDLERYINRLDKKIYDLKISKNITLQSAPQIRMIQDVNHSLAEKIQSSILTSIPLWKNQMSIAMSLMNQQNAAKTQQQVTDTTNLLLNKNSEMLKDNAIKTAELNERSIVDIETLQNTQSNIIDTIKETITIQHNGRLQREQGEKELQRLEEELKSELLKLQHSK